MKALPVILALCIHKVAAFTCSAPLNNVTALIYRDANSNYTVSTIKNNLELQNVHKISIEPINRIPKLCKNSISNLTKLNTLSLIYNGLEFIEPQSFANLPSLKILELNYNRLQEIPNGVFNNLSIAELYLTGNKIYNIHPHAFTDMSQLEILDLSFNQVQIIEPDWFKNCGKISRLNFVYNYIPLIQEHAFKNLAGLQQKINFWFLNNTIATIHRDAFKGIKNVGKLWLSNNKMRYLDDTIFSDVKFIDSLNLENNELFCLSDRLLNNTRAGEVYMAGNPIICNCLVKLEQWGVATNTKTYNSGKNLDKCQYKSKYQEPTTKAPEGVPVDL